MGQHPFDYDRAFSRNLGFITVEEREIIKNKKIAIAGLGGVGGIHLITLVRMGFQKFHLSEFDEYEIHNFNRQYGANMTTLNAKKLDVMVERAKEINPNIEVKLFPDGVNAKNVDQFLEGVDLYLDGLDLFATEARQIVFKTCYVLNIPASTVAPIGMGAALINFLPGKMSFDEYFGFDSDQYRNAIKLVVGLSPKFPHLKSLVDRSYANLKQQKTSSTPMGVMLSAGVIGTETIKILLNRGPITYAPTSIHFDSYLNRIFKTTTWFGCRNWIFRFKVIFLERMLRKLSS
ncbi:MAG: ThiF family adenylyltransferase [Rhizobacter sp.]|nr:ThiF family adenylyltransferase [Bacteriovorax sp.]